MALTGQDTDRLPQEKERGISIDLGFASMELNGVPIAIVDVPGHERFIKNMLAGVSGIDMALFVVAADEGPMPQTREHLDILDLLGVDRGVVAITKVDLVDSEWLALVREETRLLLKGTSLEGSPIIGVSSVKGIGLKDLRDTIWQAVERSPRRKPGGVTRLPVDRVFTVAGFGTVVTGTLVAGEVSAGQRLDVVPGGPDVKVRHVEVHGQRVEKAFPGQRVALNLAKAERGQIWRGAVLAEPGSLTPCDQFAGEFRLLEGARRPLLTSVRVRLHVGTSEVLGRLALLDREALEPGASCLVRFKAESSMAVGRGDRFIVRSYSPPMTIGGGSIIATKWRFRRHNAHDLRNLRMLESAKGQELILVELSLQRAPLNPGELALLLSEDAGGLALELSRLSSDGRVLFWEDRGLVMHPAVYEELASDIVDFLEIYHGEHPMRRGVPKEELRARVVPDLDQRQFSAILEAMAAEARLVIARDVLSLTGRETFLDQRGHDLKAKIEREFRQGGFSPPLVQDLHCRVGSTSQETGDLLRVLLEEERLIKVEGNLMFHRDCIDEAKRMVRDYLKQHGSMTVAAFRDLIGTSRKYALPLLGYLDGTRFTRREGDKRTLHGS